MTNQNSQINIIGIDYDHTLQDDLARLLNPIHYQYHLAQSFEQGEIVLKNIDADVVIISSSLPLEDRLNICRRFKKISKTPILVLSNSRKSGLLEQTLDAGADEYILKPISGSLLIAHLNTLTRRFREEKTAEKLRERIEKNVETET